MPEILAIGYQPQFLEGATTSVNATQATEVVNLQTAQALLANEQNIKEAAQVATVGNLDLATGGLLVVDGYQTLDGDRILVKEQTDPVENGIYIAAAGAWVRSDDANDAGEITAGMQVYVYHDSTNPGHGHIYVMNTHDDDVVIGTDPISFAMKLEVSGHADDLSVTDGSFTTLTGTNVQTVLNSADVAIQANEDDIVTLDARVDALVGATGDDLGTFTGITIADASDVKAALQALETKAEADAQIYADGRVELTTQSNTAGTWTTITHNMNEDRLSAVSFFDEGDGFKNLNNAVLWRPKSGDADSIEIYHSQSKTMTIVFRA